MHSLFKRTLMTSLAALLLCQGALAFGEIRLAAHRDDGLHTVINQPLSQPLVVRVTDAQGNPVSGVAVEFATRIGTTEPAGATVYSDAQGLARFQPVSRRFGATHVLARSGHSPLPVMFRRVTTGWISSLVGDGVQAFGGNGGPAAQAQINAPFGIALRGDDLLLVDYFNHAVRRIDLTSGEIYPLAGTALQASQFWDGRSPTVEAQARDPLPHPLEMAMPDEAAVVAAVRAVPAYRDLFAEAFPGGDPVSYRNVTLALGAFQRRLLTPDAPIDRLIAGDAQALAADQKSGLAVFLREGCASCHAGPLLGGNDILLMYNYPDTQDGDQYEFRKQLGNDHKFKVSPLRNIATSAPYLHDGRYRTLRKSIKSRLDAYQVREGGLEDHVEFTEYEIRDLLAFFDALTGRIDSDYIRPPQLAAVARQRPAVAP